MADTVLKPCSCQGHNRGCVQCLGSGVVERAACRRCAGKGSTGGDAKCYDCRGEGWRPVELL